MESLVLLIDCIAMVLVIFYSWKNDNLPDGAAESGLFAMRPVAKEPAPPAAALATGPRRRAL